MSWRVTPALLNLRAAFDHECPGRDRRSDGTIGDSAHQARASDHNPDDTTGSNAAGSDPDTIPEVHALDVDADLRRPGWSMHMCVDAIVARQRTLYLDNGRDPLKYVIYDHVICSRSWGWTSWEPYDGTDPHTGHAHFSGRYGSGDGASNPENYQGTWGIEALVTNAELRAAVKAELEAAGLLTLTTKIGDKANPNRTIGDVLRDLAKWRGYEIGDPKDTKNAAIPPDSPIARVVAAAERILAEPLG